MSRLSMKKAAKRQLFSCTIYDMIRYVDVPQVEQHSAVIFYKKEQNFVDTIDFSIYNSTITYHTYMN